MTDAALALTAELRDELEQSSSDTTRLPARFSHLKAMGRSAAHCRDAMLNDYEPTLAMRLGLGTHSLLLGGPPVLLCPTKQRKGKDYTAWLEKQTPGAIVLTSKEYDRAHRMNEAVRNNAQAVQVLFQPGTIYENTILWEQNGRARRSTPDARTKRHLVDLKTARDAEPERFRWDAIRNGYNIQLADYAEAMKAEQGYPPRDVYIVAVESKRPYLCTVHRLTTGALERGAKQAATWLAQLIECEQTGKWPGYADSILDFDVPIDPVDLVWDDESALEDSGD